MLAVPTAFFLSKTEDSTDFHTRYVVPTRKICTGKYFKDFFEFISHTSYLVQCEFTALVHICFHWSLVKLLQRSRDGRSYCWRILDGSLKKLLLLSDEHVIFYAILTIKAML